MNYQAIMALIAGLGLASSAIFGIYNHQSSSNPPLINCEKIAAGQISVIKTASDLSKNDIASQETSALNQMACCDQGGNYSSATGGCVPSGGQG